MLKFNFFFKLTFEFNRCEDLKFRNLEKFIEKQKIEIKILQERLFYSEAEIKNFDEFFLNVKENFELVKINEEKLNSMRKEFEENQNLFETIFKWNDLWVQYSEFMEYTKNPCRFKCRGYNGAEEEKMRKRFKTQFLKLEEEIAIYCENYTQKNFGRVLLIKGVEWFVYFERFKNEKKKPSIKRNNRNKLMQIKQSNGFKNQLKK